MTATRAMFANAIQDFSFCFDFFLQLEMMAAREGIFFVLRISSNHVRSLTALWKFSAAEPLYRFYLDTVVM